MKILFKKKMKKIVIEEIIFFTIYYTYDIKNEEYITGKDITNSKNRFRLYI